MRRFTLLTALLLAIVFISSCNSAPSLTVQTIQPTVSAQATSDEVVLTEEQSDKIEALITAALNMSDYCTDNATFFQDISSLSTDDFLQFVYIILDYYSDSIGREFMGTGTISSKDVENIIRSAFGVDYVPKEGDNAGEGFQYSGDSFDFEADDGVIIEAWPYSFSRQSSGDILVEFYMLGDNVPGTYYIGKGEAILREDADSLFGYSLVSLTKADEADIAFTSTEASSYLPADSSRTFTAENVIDGDDSTVWATPSGKQEWIKLYFDKPQDITGLILHFGDWSSDDAFYAHSMPLYCRIEFSDGTSITNVYCDSLEIGDDTCEFFGKVINTSYVKITITDIIEGSEGSGGGIYISEINPL